MIEAADRSPDDSKLAPSDWLAELARDDSSVAPRADGHFVLVAARACGSAEFDSESPVDDRLARLSPADCLVAVVLVDWAQPGDVHSELADFPDGSPLGYRDGRWSALPVFPGALASPSADPPRGSPDAGSALRFWPMVVQDARPAPAAAS